MAITLVLAFIGVFVLAAGFMKIKGLKKFHPAIAVAGAALFFIAAAYTGGYLEYEAPDTTPPATTTSCPTFDITPSVSEGNGNLNSDQDRVTVGFYANTTAHTIAENDNTTWVDTQVTFEIAPVPFAGATADDIATLYYEVTNPDATVDSDTSGKYLVTKSGGNWQEVWTGDGTNYVSGTTTLLMTGNETLYLTIDTAQADLSYVQNELDPQTLIVKFSNGCGWTEYFYVDFTCINQHN